MAFIVQARIGSTRLPKKMILPFYNGKGILELLIQKLKIHFPSIPIVLATTEEENDTTIAELGKKEKIKVFRGSEKNVLERFIKAAEKHKISKIIRICADNPFLDMKALQILIEKFDHAQLDYLAFCTSDGKPSIKTHFGFWAEGVSLNALKKVRHQTESPIYLEHVTNFIYEKKNGFKLKFIRIPSEVEIFDIRLTVDTQEDFEITKEIYAKSQEKGISGTKEIVKFVSSNYDWMCRMQNQIERNEK